MPTAPLPVSEDAVGAGQLRPREAATGMSARFIYTRGVGVSPAGVRASCQADYSCYTMQEPMGQMANYIIVLDVDPAPASARLLVVSEGRGLNGIDGSVGDPEIAFDPAVGVSALESGNKRAGYVRGTRIAYIINGSKSVLRAYDAATNATTEVAAQANWATGPGETGALTVYFHASVARAVFLWSDSDPLSTSVL
jgi:hypothetical protein